MKIKKIFKGCLITSGMLIILLIIGGVAIYFYAKSPNRIINSEKPIGMKDIISNLDFPKSEIPKIILNQPDSSIMYQAYIMENDWASEYTYRVVIKLSSDPNFRNKLPMSNHDITKLKELFKFQSIEKAFNPKLSLPQDMKTPSGTKIRVFSKDVGINMPLKKGTYQYFVSESIDKDGYFKELIIYDKETKMLYYERMRFHAFQ
jgi:hypothetical protein